MGGHRGLLRLVTVEQEERDQLAHQVVLLRDKTMHLERALETSRDIGVAMGIVMAREKVTRQCAWDMLRMVSQHQNRRVSAIAVDVIESGELPVGAGRPLDIRAD